MISDEIIKVLDALCSKFGIAVDWTSNNIMPHMQEVAGKCVNYELWTSVMWLFIWTIPLIISVILIVKYWKDEDPAFVPFTLIAIFLIIGVVEQATDIIACKTFPEKIIIQELQCLSNTMK